MKTRKIITLEGSESEINQLISLFEREELVQLPQFKILDIAKVLPNTMTVQESAIATISPIIETIKNEVNSLFDFWRECLEFKGMQIVRGESINVSIQGG
jgi:hypothetical protein